MERRVQPELLDELPARDCRAGASRRDLERLNAWMGHPGILARVLRQRLDGEPPRHIAELGAGDGKVMLNVAGRLAGRWPGVTVRLLDRQDAVESQTRLAFHALSWKTEILTTDVFAGLSKGALSGCQAVIANLFLHHFSSGELAELLARVVEQSSLFIALEPSRSVLGLFFSRRLGLLGCGEVTRHDAPVSVRAGFAGKELSQLWPKQEPWQVREGSVGLFTHLFVAQRLAER